MRSRQLRSKLLLGAMATFTGLLGCVGVNAAAAVAQSHQKVTLTWWGWSSAQTNLIKAFERAYPWITVTPPPNYGSGAVYYAKLTTAMASGTGPDLAPVEYDHYPQFTTAHDFVNIAKYVDQYKKDFPAWVWDQLTQGSAVYGMPGDIGPMALMYQPSVLQKYKLPMPTTWATFASDAVALHKANPALYMTYFPINDGDYLESLFWQAGASPFHELPNGTWQINVDGPIEKQVINYWGKLINEKAIEPSSDFTSLWGHQIANGTFASYLGAAWAPTNVVDEYLSPSVPQTFQITSMPQWSAGAHADSNWGGTGTGVTKDTPSSAVPAAALFLAWLSTSKAALTIDETPATEGGIGNFPASLERASTPQFNRPIPHFVGHINQEFGALANDVPTGFQWDPWDSEFVSFVNTQMGQAAAGKESWDAALANTQQQLVSYAKDAGYSVQG
jgi:multiple sugar transport system substrate-binding protein